jgi:hypothetical protein
MPSADIDPLALDAPCRFTLGHDELAKAGQTIEGVLEWIGVHSRDAVHYLEPYPTPEMEYSIVFEDVLDAAPFRTIWGAYDVDTPSEEDRRKIAQGAATMRRLRGL